MKKIALTKGKYAIVDDEDFEWLNQFKWAGDKYATRVTSVRMHTLIMNPPKGKVVDYINGDSLDNRRCNLRIATIGQNSQNSSKQLNRQSKYKGVCGKRKIWRANIACNKKKYSLGSFKSEIHAAMAYDIAAADLFGEFAKLNFKPVISG